MTPAQRQLRNRFYESPAWRSIRRVVLHRDNFTCSECGRIGGRGLTVHHIKPAFDEAGVMPNALDPDNLCILCRPCHTRLHDDERRQALTPSQLAWRNLIERLYPAPTLH